MRPRVRAKGFLVWLWTLSLLCAAACKVSEDDIETWKGTVKGPRKMLAVVMADKYDLALRTSAALALVEMERQDVDGVAELQRVIASLDTQTRNQLIDGLTPGLTKLMQAEKGKEEDPDEGPPPIQIRAKDAAFALIAHAGPESRKALIDAVMRWYTTDFNGRNLSGNYSAEQVVRALGSPAAKILVDALGAKIPQQALVKLAELIGQLGDDATKQLAAQKLVAIETEMGQAPFLDWLKGQIATQLKAAGQAADATRIEKTAILNRDKFIDEGVIPAMKHLADQPQVRDRLLAIAAASNADPLRRARALQALESKVGEQQLQPLLALALDASAPATVRDYAFDRVGDIQSTKAIPPMWPLVEDAKNQRLRWRAGELVLGIGGNAVLAEFFAKLPSGDVAYEPEELEGYALRMGQMNPLPRTELTAQLSSPDWWDRVIALQFFQRKGTEADVSAMSRLANDDAKVKGDKWGAVDTVGKVAKEAIRGLRERLGQAQGKPAEQGS